MHNKQTSSTKPSYYLFINNSQVSFMGIQPTKKVLAYLLKQQQEKHPGAKCEYRLK